MLPGNGAQQGRKFRPKGGEGQAAGIKAAFGHHNVIAAVRNMGLFQTETLADEALQAVAAHGVACLACNRHAEPPGPASLIPLPGEEHEALRKPAAAAGVTADEVLPQQQPVLA